MGKLVVCINIQSLYKSNQAKKHTFYHVYSLEILPNITNIR